jgi:hypothetical protein
MEIIFVGFSTIVGILLVAFGYLTVNEDMKQWGVILAIGGVLILLAEREVRSSRILGPNQTSEAQQTMKRIVQSALGFLFIIDPYPGKGLIEPLEEAPRNLRIRVLTMNLVSNRNINDFETSLIEVMRTHSDVKARYAPKGNLHDRFILTRPYGWSLGQSIKDLGKKISRVSSLSVEETETLLEKFETIWAESEPLFGK